MSLRLKILFGSVLLLLATTASLLIWNGSTTQTAHANLIRVDEPHQNQIIKSPLVITGKARGMWYFEATFPVKLLDETGNVIARGSVQAQGEWMTNQFVPFRVELLFAKPESKRGMLVLEKSNPSDLAENEDSIKIPVLFEN